MDFSKVDFYVIMQFVESLANDYNLALNDIEKVYVQFLYKVVD